MAKMRPSEILFTNVEPVPPCDRCKELEKQNEELLKVVIESCKSDYDSLTLEAFEEWYSEEIKILESIKQKPIEEILKEVTK